MSSSMMIIVLLVGVGGMCLSSSLAGGLAYSQNWLCDSLGENFGVDCTASPGPTPSGDGSSSPPSDDSSSDSDDDKKIKDDCVYLYEDKDGKKFLISKCTKSSKTYKGSKLDGMSSIRVGKYLTAYLYDKNDKKKTFKGNKDKVYNLSGKWNDDTKKLVIKYKKKKSSSDSNSNNSSSSGKNNPSSSGNNNTSSSSGDISKIPDEYHVAIFTDRDYQGGQWSLRQFSDIDLGFHHLYSKKWNDTISSVQVRPGYALVTWENRDRTGTQNVFKKSTPYVGDSINDTISYIEVIKV